MSRNEATTDIAIFAGGCFWGVQYYFDQVPGVVETEAGYIGGHVESPTYEQVCTHTTGHAEAVKIIFDTSRVSFATLMKHFFLIHDPTQVDGQGPDIGDNYRSTIFYTSDEQKASAIRMIKSLEKQKVYSRPIVTEVTKADTFWPAERYHQKYAARTGHGACHVDYRPL